MTYRDLAIRIGMRLASGFFSLVDTVQKPRGTNKATDDNPYLYPFLTLLDCGCNSDKLGNLYFNEPDRFRRAVSVGLCFDPDDAATWFEECSNVYWGAEELHNEIGQEAFVDQLWLGWTKEWKQGLRSHIPEHKRRRFSRQGNRELQTIDHRPVFPILYEQMKAMLNELKVGRRSLLRRTDLMPDGMIFDIVFQNIEKLSDLLWISLAPSVEAREGAEVEIWTLLEGADGECSGFRFRLHTATVSADEGDNRPRIFRRTREGLRQLDLLLERCREIRAVPLYALFSREPSTGRTCRHADLNFVYLADAAALHENFVSGNGVFQAPEILAGAVPLTCLANCPILRPEDGAMDLDCVMRFLAAHFSPEFVKGAFFRSIPKSVQLLWNQRSNRGKFFNMESGHDLRSLLLQVSDGLEDDEFSSELDDVGSVLVFKIPLESRPGSSERIAFG